MGASRLIYPVIILITVFLAVVTGERTRAAQNRNVTSPPDFFAQLENTRSIFYHDESIPYRVWRRSDKPSVSGCSFGWKGESEQLLRNGKIIHEEAVGAVEATALRVIAGVSYQGTSGDADFINIVNDEQVDPKDNYQIRATCGTEVSEPTSPFHLSVWKQPVDGLTVLVRPTKTQFRVGEPITVEVTMKNVGKRSRWCPVPLPDDGQTRNFWQLEPYDNDRRPAPAYYEELAFRRGLRVLPAGKSRRAVFLMNYFHTGYADDAPALGSKPGAYRLSFSVYLHVDDEDIPAKYRMNLWNGELTSNSFTIVIK